MGYVLAIGGVASALIVLIVGASTIAALGHAVPKELWAIGGALSGSLVGILAKSPAGRGAGQAAMPLAAAQETIDAANKAAKERGETEQRLRPALAQTVAGAVQDVERVGEQAKQNVVSMAGIGAGTDADADTAALTAATSVAHAQGQKLLTLATKVQAAPADDALAASLRVHEAAQSAAVTAAAVAAKPSDAGWLSGLKAMVTEPKLLVPFGLFVITATLGILLSLGVIKPAACPSGLTCTYAKTTAQAANVMISLASASVGALIGMFATASATAAPTAKAPDGTAKPA